MRKLTNWDKYIISPNSSLSKIFFLNFVVKAYYDLLKKIKFNEPIQILEFGCGTGYINFCLSKKFNIKKITLVDLNKRMLSVSRKALSNVDFKTEFINENFFNIKYYKKYHLVHSQGVIEHFEKNKRIQLLKKHCDAVKDDGYCILYFPIPTISYLLFSRIAKFFRIWQFHDEIPLKRNIVINEMKSLGFVPIKSNYFWKFFLTEAGIIFKKSSLKK